MKPVLAYLVVKDARVVADKGLETSGDEPP